MYIESKCKLEQIFRMTPPIYSFILFTFQITRTFHRDILFYSCGHISIFELLKRNYRIIEIMERFIESKYAHVQYSFTSCYGHETDEKVR